MTRRCLHKWLQRCNCGYPNYTHLYLWTKTNNVVKVYLPTKSQFDLQQHAAANVGSVSPQSCLFMIGFTCALFTVSTVARITLTLEGSSSIDAGGCSVTVMHHGGNTTCTLINI